VVPLSWPDLLITLGAGGLVLLALEFAKVMERRKPLA
jgi:hypothetical protein